MARRVLGNDPFARGAPVREAALDDDDLPPVAPPLPLPPARPTPREKKPPRPRPLKTAERAPSREDRNAEPAPALEPFARRAPIPFATSDKEGDSHLAETVGARLRTLLDRQIPALFEGLARSSIEALGLAAQPVPVSDVDAFGLAQEFVDRWQPVLARVLESYFRAEVSGLEKIPTDRPAILVCNHSGILPYDEILLSVAVRAGVPSLNVRPLSEDFAINASFAGSWLNRFGLVRASQDNAERLLRAGALVAVFPEGSQGIAKLYRNRYQLQRFGRGGFVRLALRTQVPVIPVALVGGEEAQPVMARVRLPQPLRPSVLPLTPTFPWLGPLGLLPLPTHWHIQVGDPLVWKHSPADANDRPLVAGLTEDVRQTLQTMLDGMVRKRTAVFF